MKKKIIGHSEEYKRLVAQGKCSECGGYLGHFGLYAIGCLGKNPRDITKRGCGFYYRDEEYASSIYDQSKQK